MVMARSNLTVWTCVLGAALAGCGGERAEEPVGTAQNALTTVFTDNFASLGQWTESGEGDWNTETLHASTGYPGTASGSPAAHVDDCDTSCTITSPAINLSGATSGSLSFLRFVDSEFDSTDFARVELFNGTSWVQVRNWFGGSGDTNAWASETIDLAPYLGRTDFRMRFVAKADSTSEHFHVDDVRVNVETGTTGFTSTDIGPTGVTGTTTVANNVYTIRGGGVDIYDASDAFRFVHKTLSGDGQVTARIDTMTNTHDWAKVGVMIRDSLAPNAKNVFMLLRPTLGSAYQARDLTGGSTTSTWNDAPEEWMAEHKVRYLRVPKWLRITRQSNVFTVYTSDDGLCWYNRWKQTLAFDDSQAFFGVALSSAVPGTLGTTTVSNFTAQSAISPFNATCDRSAVDGDLPAPTSWIFPPGRFGTSNWNYTTTNPNGVTTPVKCYEWEEDPAPFTDQPRPRKDGPDHPNCPDASVTLPWTLPSFNTSGWQLNKPSGFGSPQIVEGDKLSTPLNSRAIWLRKSFTVANQTDKNNAVLWGRWADGITVYINGVLATVNSVGGVHYRHLGLSNEARAALVVGGTNVIAVRLEWDTWWWDGNNQLTQFDAWDRFFDMGLARESRIASLPVDRMVEPQPQFGAYVDAFKEIMQEQGVSGSTLAVRKNGQLLVSAGFGWSDKNMTTPMSRNSILRLASNDKVYTQAAIVKLIRDGKIGAETPVFPYLNLQPMPGFSPGANVNLITVEHLRTHTSGIGGPAHSQNALDEAVYRFGINTAQWTSTHYARWLYSLDATDVGGEGRYSSNGYFLLRYLAERLVAPKTLEQYLAQDMGLTGVNVSRERLAGRHPSEPGYINREPSWDRWLALEDFLALGASAPGYTSFFDNFAIWYDYQGNNVYTPVGGGGMGGAMAGTWSIALADHQRGLNIVMVASNSGNFDEAVTRVNDVTNSDCCLFGPIDPRVHIGRFNFIQSVAQSGSYINYETGTLVSTPIPAGSWSAHWTLEPVDATNFRIKNRWVELYLNNQSGVLQLSTVAPTSTSAHWQLVPVGNGYNIRSRAQPTHYLNVQSGSLTSGPVSPTLTTAQWRFCD
jgi:CubicO group peptidase (beta-lactamase class C family)